MAKIQMHFNGNFSLKKEEIKRILLAASENKGLKDTLENLITRTSLGNAKVNRIKSWSVRSGLIKDNYLSQEGQLVLQLDPNLESLVTDWLVHFYLSFGDKGLQLPPENLADWGGWSYFVYVFLPQNKMFTFEALFQSSCLVFEEESKVIKDRLKYILKAYTETHALAACKFLTKKGEQYQSGNAQLPNSYLISYFLAKLWERNYKEQGSILTEFILTQKMGLAPILGISTEALQKQLNTLEAYGIIEQRRTVPPFQIVSRWQDPLILLEKAYESDR